MLALTQRGGLMDRMIGAAVLDGAVYEDVEHDTTATGQAALVVVLGAIAAGIGALTAGLEWLAVGIVVALISWGVYAYVAYWVGTHFFKGPQTSATWGELLRTLGFANSPALLLVLAIIPVLGLVLGLVVLVWILVTTVVAIQHALDLDIGRAIGTAVVSWLVLLVVRVVLFAVLT